ncbi:vitelline membrane outer layer protein 1 homolog [Mytilus trossulus]|uniref:vitelline membrane outer layer protein 1 homolog n=1 Tax=Mytilus trossulus TaxID=6551 RepID=UPI0030047D19
MSFLFQNVRLHVKKYQTTKEFFRVDKNKEIRSMDLEVIGSMSEIQCAAFCEENSDICCEITYVKLSRECKLVPSGCCQVEFNNVSGSNILHPGRKFSDYISTLSVTNGGVFGDWTYQEFCTKGHYAVGYRMKIEGPDDDRTELTAIEIICGSRGGFPCGETSSSGQQGWGDWTEEVHCPTKTLLVAFSLQVQQYNVGIDNTGANYVKFKCRYFKYDAGYFDLSYPPGYGTYGSYGEWSDACPVNSAICGIQTKIHGGSPYGQDDTALNDVRFFCFE